MTLDKWKRTLDTHYGVPALYERMVWKGNLNTSYEPSDFVNPDDYDPHGRQDKAFIILNAGVILAIVFAEYDSYCEQDALDEAVDRGKLDGFKLSEEALKDYETGEYTEIGNEHTPPRKVMVEDVEATIEHGGWPVYDSRVAHLGNASEPFDQESLDIWAVKASIFADDPALMSFNRVNSYLDDRTDEARREYDRQELDNEGGSKKYRRWKDLADTMTQYDGTLTWSGAGDVPELLSDVRGSPDGPWQGSGSVVGYFDSHGFLGVTVQPADGSTVVALFGAEIEVLASNSMVS